MATDTTTPTPATHAMPQGDPDRPTGKVLPVVLLVLVLAGLGFGAYSVANYVWSVQAGDNQDIKFVFRRLEESVRLGGREVDAKLFWLPILIPVLLLGMTYAIWMYVRDSKQVGLLWATFLATVRCCVYAILAVVFLLPALQTWDSSRSTSRVLILWDLSDSMNLSDEIPTEGRTPTTRLDQVIRFVSQDQNGFLRDLTFDAKDGKDKNPVFLYAFGGRLDEDAREFKPGQPTFSTEEWYTWARMDLHQWVLDGLSPEGKDAVRAAAGFAKEQPANPIELANYWTTWFKDTDVWDKLTLDDKLLLEKKRDLLPKKLEARQAILMSTSYPDALLSAITKEGNNMLAGIIVIGDGRSTAGSDSTLIEALNRANNAKVPIFTVAVGEVRERVNIRIADLLAPEQAPPDEKFDVRVEVDGEGLADRDFECLLDMYKPNQTPGKDKPVLTIPSKGKFIVSGSIPHGQVEFTIDPTAKEFLSVVKPPEKSEGKPGFEQGEWKFVARVPKAKGESFTGKEHVSDIPASVHIVDKPLRVLLFAGGPGKDYQFCRRLFANEVLKKRAEMSVCLQVTDQKGDRAQDVPPERLLKQFPHYINNKKDAADKADERYYNLAQYDLIIAFDPDWTQVAPESLKLLEEWVDDGGGLVVLAGPINTYQLARGANAEKLKPIIDLLPVVVEDSRTAGLGVNQATNKAWHLRFPGASRDTDYLKLDDDAGATDPLAGWSEFFWGKKGKVSDFDAEPALRGFFTYYPVAQAKPGTSVVATFADPQAKINNATEGKQVEMPFLVTGQSKKGKVVFLGWEGMWRLRLFKEIFHERFWTKLARFAGSGNLTRQSNRGVLIMGKQFMANQPIKLEAQLKQQNGKPLEDGAEVVAKLTPPPGVTLAKPDIKLEVKREAKGQGYFRTQFLLPAPGKYEFVLPIPGSGEILRREFYVKEGNPELDNSLPNYAALDLMASEVSKLRVSEQHKTELRRKLRAKPEGTPAAPAAVKDSDEPRLAFNLQTARAIPEYLSLDSRTIRSRGKIEDLWSDGPALSSNASQAILWVVTVLGFAIAVGCGIGAVVLLAMGRAGTAGLLVAAACFFTFGAIVYLLTALQYSSKLETVVTTTSALLFVVVGLLSIEWLTRKLLRLA